MKPKSKEDKLASKKERMADPGYYVEYVISHDGICPEPSGVSACSVICIGADATAKYCRYMADTEWYTLNWNCAPSRKFMATKNHKMNIKEGDFDSRYEYYPTWADFVNRCTFKVSPLSKRVKAPNDTFSP